MADQVSDELQGTRSAIFLLLFNRLAGLFVHSSEAPHIKKPYKNAIISVISKAPVLFPY